MKCRVWIAMLAAAALHAQGGVVEGKVVSTVDGSPVRRATVLLRAARINEDGPQLVRDHYETETDGSGNFSIGGVTPGRYVGVPSRAGFGVQPPNRFATTAYFPEISVDDGQRVTGVVLRMTPLGVISGRVLDADGFPIASARVEALQYVYQAGKKVLQPQQQTGSDDRGEYRLYDLFPGTYYLRATAGQPGVFTPGDIRGARPPGLAPTHYPGEIEPSRAAPLAVPAGGELRSIDIRMQTRVLYTIRGRMPVAGSPESPRSFGLSVQRRGGDTSPEFFNWLMVAQDKFEIPGVPPGTYLLTAQQGGVPLMKAQMSVRAFVEVVSHDVDGVELSFSPTLEISGVVHTTGSATVALEQLQVSLLTAEEGLLVSTMAAPVKADGTFTVRNILPDLYRVQVGPITAAYVKSVKLGERELAGRQLDLRQAGAGALTITVCGDMGRLDGRVTDDLGNPAATVNVTLIPDQDTPDWRERFHNILTDSQGAYFFRNVVPGHYTLFAWKDVERGAPQDPDFRKPFAKLGVGVDVQPGGRQIVALKSVDGQHPPQ